MKLLITAFTLALLATAATGGNYVHPALKKAMTQARADGISYGKVTLELRYDEVCETQLVKIHESVPAGYFDEAVVTALTDPDHGWYSYRREVPADTAILNKIPISAYIRSIRLQDGRWGHCLIDKGVRLRAWKTDENVSHESNWSNDDTLDPDSLPTFTVPFEINLQDE
ncbi:MAG TPA: hypothetical protein VF275_00750 [Gammaproteobacteria bacterium]